MPALLFSFASWPSAGLLDWLLFFLIPALALPHRAPKASPPAAAGALGLVTGLALAMVVGVELEGKPGDPAVFDMPPKAPPECWAWTPPK